MRLSSRVTLKQIARELGVSVMTVSRALNNRTNVDHSTRQEVLETAQRLGYRPNHIARSLVMNKTNTIGVIVPEITHSFFPEVIRGIEEVAHRNDYQLILMHTMENQDREAEAITTLESKRVDGLLISTAETVENYRKYEQLIDQNYPLVFFDRCVFDIGASCVTINDRTSARQITEHLIEHGYEKIAHLEGPEKISIGKKRRDGFVEAMNNHGLTVRDEWIIPSALQEKGGYRAMKKLLDLPKGDRPRAVVAVNDPSAFGAMQAIHEEGFSIPEDFALTGFSDDIRAKLMATPLTTIRQPAYEVGKKASDKLIALIEDSDEEIEELVVPTELVVRESCGCPALEDKNVMSGHMELAD